MKEDKRVEEMNDRELLESIFLMNRHIIKRQTALEAKLFNDNKNDYEEFRKILIDSIEDNEEIDLFNLNYEKLLHNEAVSLLSEEELKKISKYRS